MNKRIKRKIILFNVILILMLTCTGIINSNIKAVNVNKNLITMDSTSINKAKYAILIEVDSGQVLYENNAHIRRPPASITKIMSIKLFMDALKTKRINLNDVITTSEYASKMGGSQIYLSVGEKMTVSDLLKAVVIASANDATVALAEAISGSEDFFVKSMNNEVKKLGLVNTNFINSSGLPENNHYTSCYDIAMIARSLLLNYEEEIIPITSTYEYYLRENTDKRFWLVNTNKLIKHVPDIDGLKTGWTTEAGYCLVSTMKKNDMRLIAVVMGSSTSEERNSNSVSLLNYGMANFEKIVVNKKGTVIKSEQNIMVSPANYRFVIDKDIVYIKEKNDTTNHHITQKVIIDKKRILTYHANEVGVIQTYLNNRLIDETTLSLNEEIVKPNLWLFIKELMKKIF